jgi:PglZ domain-containing protein
MGKMTQLLREMVKKQIDDHGIVVWYDPSAQYKQALASFDFPSTLVLRLRDSILQLRAEAEPYLEYVEANGVPAADCAVPPKLLVYAHTDRAGIRFALAELECAGTIMEPGAADPACNTRLRVVAEQVFNTIRPDKVDEIGRKADDGTYSLEELDKIAESGPIGIDILADIFETNNADEIRLKFLASDAYDEKLVRKKALKDFLVLVEADTGIEITSDATCAVARKTAARLLLMGDLVSRLPADKIPAAWKTISVSSETMHHQKMQELADVWRNRLDLREAYVSHARAVEQEVGIASVDVDPKCLTGVHTFSILESRLLQHAESLILDEHLLDAMAIIRKRKLGFWSVSFPPNNLRWAALESAARVIIIGEDIRAAVKQVSGSSAVFEAYTSPADAWFTLDTVYRHMERQYAAFDLELGGEHDQLEQVMVVARRAYASAIEKEADLFNESLHAEGYGVDGVLKQTAIFADHVAPAIASGCRVAYLVVDALRCEMGSELAESLAGDFEVQFVAALAQLPTITSVGMAAVLPGASDGILIEPKDKKGLKVVLNAHNVTDRSARIQHLSEVLSSPCRDLKLNDLIKPSKKKQELILQTNFLYVTSQEIDRLGEEGENEDEIRVFMDEVLEKLGKGIRRLAALGVEEIIVTADHGHLFAAPLDSGMRVDAPGGETVELHRRVWIGNGGAAAAGYVRASSRDLGLDGSLEFAFPAGLSGFKAKGAGAAYMHGGTSLQEMVVPVIILRPIAVKPEQLKAAHVALDLAKPTITTRFFSLTLTYSLSGLFGPEAISTKIVIKSGKKEVGVPAMAAYGYEDSTREIQLKKDTPNAVTIMLTDVEDLEMVSVQVLDAGSQVELRKTESIPVQITI